MVKISEEKMEEILDFLTWLDLALVVLWTIANVIGWLYVIRPIDTIPLFAATYIAGVLYWHLKSMSNILKEA